VNMATIQNHLGDIKSFLSIGKKKIIGEFNINIHEHTYVVTKLKGMFFSGTLIDHGQNEGLPVNDVSGPSNGILCCTMLTKAYMADFELMWNKLLFAQAQTMKTFETTTQILNT